MSGSQRDLASEPITYLIDFDETIFQYHMHGLLNAYDTFIGKSQNKSDDDKWDFLKQTNQVLGGICSQLPKATQEQLQQNADMSKPADPLDIIGEDTLSKLQGVDPTWLADIKLLSNKSSNWKKVISDVLGSGEPFLRPSRDEWTNVLSDASQNHIRICVVTYSAYPQHIKKFIDEVVMASKDVKIDYSIEAWLPNPDPATNPNKIMHAINYLYKNKLIKTDDVGFQLELDKLNQQIKTDSKKIMPYKVVSTIIEVCQPETLREIHGLLKRSIVIDDSRDNNFNNARLLRMLSDKVNLDKLHKMSNLVDSLENLKDDTQVYRDFVSKYMETVNDETPTEDEIDDFIKKIQKKSESISNLKAICSALTACEAARVKVIRSGWLDDKFNSITFGKGTKLLSDIEKQTANISLASKTLKRSADSVMPSGSPKSPRMYQPAPHEGQEQSVNEDTKLSRINPLKKSQD